MKLPCAVIRDLLPLYAEEMVEKETKDLIGQHLSDCPACREKLSGLETATGAPIDTAKPLQSLKKQIRKRRRYAAVIAALCVFIAVYTLFYHGNAMRPVAWEEGLIEVKGVETRPLEEVYEEDAPAELPGPEADVLVLRADSRINGWQESLIRDDDDTKTLLIRGWTSGSQSAARDYTEMVFCPIPDRLIYEDGSQQKLLWGEPMNGGVETLPRLALGYYALMAAALAMLSGILWLVLRRNEKSRIVRQVFFAPLSYLAAHLLIKGFHTASFFMERDFISILLLTAALYVLLTLVWQVLLQRRKER